LRFTSTSPAESLPKTNLADVSRAESSSIKESAPRSDQLDRSAQVVLNLPRTLLRLGDDKGLFNSMAQRFPDYFRRAEDRMQLAAARYDWPTLHKEAHSLKCGASMMGATSLSNCAASLEGLARCLHNSPDAQASAVASIPAALQELGHEGELILEELRALTSCMNLLVEEVIRPDYNTVASRAEALHGKLSQGTAPCQHIPAQSSTQSPGSAPAAARTICAAAAASYAAPAAARCAHCEDAFDFVLQ